MSSCRRRHERRHMARRRRAPRRRWFCRNRGGSDDRSCGPPEGWFLSGQHSKNGAAAHITSRGAAAPICTIPSMRLADFDFELLRLGDLLIFNDTKVIPARLIGRRGMATVEVTLAHDLGGGTWRAYAKGARRLHPGDRIEFAADFAARV